MKKFISNISFFFIPIILFVTPSFTLFYFSGEFFKTPDSIFKEMRNGNILVGYKRAQSNYRYIKWKNIINHEAYDIWALGSSRVWEFREDMFSKSFYNLGYTFSTIIDLKNFIRAIPKDKLPKLIILGLDQWMFNTDWVNKQITINNYWEYFQYFPDFQSIKNINSQILKSDGINSFEILKKSISSTDKVGLESIINNIGLRNDGSLSYGDWVSKSTKASFLNFEDAIHRVKKGNMRLEYGINPRSQSFDELRGILEYLKSHNVELISFFTPFPNAVYKEMENNSQNYEYIKTSSENLKLIFNDYSYEFWDFTEPFKINSKDNEFIDGLHGGEKIYIKILFYMHKYGLTIKKYININKLKNDFKYAINNLVVYN